MRVLLAFMFLALALGLVPRRLGRKETMIIFAISVVVAGIYYGFPRTI